MDKVVENFTSKNRRAPTEEEMGPLRLQAGEYAQQILNQPQGGEEEEIDGDGDGEGEEGDEGEERDDDQGEEGEGEGEEEEEEEEEQGDEEQDQEQEEDQDEGNCKHIMQQSHRLFNTVELNATRQFWGF